MDTTVEQRWLWRIIASLWDPLIFFLVFLFVYVLGALTFGNVGAFGTLVFGTAIYGFAVYFSFLKSKEDVYPWYLATKAENKGRYQEYWFWKHRYRLARYVRSSSPFAEGDLFIKLKSRQVAESRGLQLPNDRIPGLQLLRRAFRQRNYEIRFLMSEDNQKAAMTVEIKRLDSHVREGETLMDGYLRYLITLYLDFPEPSRELMIAHSEDRMWDRLEQRPLLSKILYLLIAVAMAALTLRVLGFPVAVP